MIYKSIWVFWNVRDFLVCVFGYHTVSGASPEWIRTNSRQFQYMYILHDVGAYFFGLLFSLFSPHHYFMYSCHPSSLSVVLLCLFTHHLQLVCPSQSFLALSNCWIFSCPVFFSLLRNIAMSSRFTILPHFHPCFYNSIKFGLFLVWLLS